MLAARRRRREPDVERLGVLRRVDALGLEAGDALLDAVRHRRLGRLGAEAVDHGLQAVDLLGLQRRLLGPPRLVLGTRALVLAVGAPVLDDLADRRLGRAVEVEHAGDRLVEQFEVVADHEQRTLVLAQEAEQPFLGVDVEVVRRLVEAQHVGAGEQDAGQLDPATLPARQRADRLLQPGVGDAEAGGHRPRLALGRVAAVRAERLFGVEVPRHVALVGVLLHGDAQLLDADHLVVDAAAGQHVGDAAAAVEGGVDLGVLRQVPEAALAHHPAGLGFGRAAEHLEQAGLAGAVAADDAHLVARHHREAGGVDDESSPHFHRDRLGLEHPVQATGSRET